MFQWLCLKPWNHVTWKTCTRSKLVQFHFCVNKIAQTTSTYVINNCLGHILYKILSPSLNPKLTTCNIILLGATDLWKLHCLQSAFLSIEQHFCSEIASEGEKKKSKEFPKRLKFGFPEGFSSVCLFCCLETDLSKRFHVDRVFSGRGSLMEKDCLIDMSRGIRHARKANAHFVKAVSQLGKTETFLFQL